MADERWLPIAGFEGFYEVSDLGRVRSLARVVTAMRDRELTTWNLQSRVLAARPAPLHMAVTLSREGVHTHCRVHLLVLKTFIGPRPEGKWGLHWDDDPKHNQLPNLYWGTPPENMHDRVRNGKHPGANKTHCKHGHEFSPENTKLRPNGGRWCIECCRRIGREGQRRRRAAARA